MKLISRGHATVEKIDKTLIIVIIALAITGIFVGNLPVPHISTSTPFLPPEPTTIAASTPLGSGAIASVTVLQSYSTAALASVTVTNTTNQTP